MLICGYGSGQDSLRVSVWDGCSDRSGNWGTIGEAWGMEIALSIRGYRLLRAPHAGVRNMPWGAWSLTLLSLAGQAVISGGQFSTPIQHAMGGKRSLKLFRRRLTWCG